MKYLKKIGLGICIVIGVAFCCAWVYVKADTVHRETKMIVKLFNGE